VGVTVLLQWVADRMHVQKDQVGVYRDGQLLVEGADAMIAGGIVCAFNHQGGKVLSTAGGQIGTCFPFGPEGVQCFAYLQSLGTTITADGSKPVSDLQKMLAMYTLADTPAITNVPLFLLAWPASQNASLSQGGGRWHSTSATR